MIQHTKNQEYLKLNEKRQSINDNTKIIKMKELLDKKFKAAKIKMLQQTTKTLLKQMKKLKISASK